MPAAPEYHNHLSLPLLKFHRTLCTATSFEGYFSMGLVTSLNPSTPELHLPAFADGTNERSSMSSVTSAVECFPLVVFLDFFVTLLLQGVIVSASDTTANSIELDRMYLLSISTTHYYQAWFCFAVLLLQ